jgi:FkbM family methyltransferase
MLNRLIDLSSRVVNKAQRAQTLRWARAKAGVDFQEGHLGTLEFLRYIQKDVNPINTVFDIGAHFGYWTRLCKAVFPDAAVHAFEPLDAHRLKFIEHTRNLHNVALHDLALDSEEGVGTLFLTSSTDSSSILRTTNRIQEEYRVRETGAVGIKKDTLDHMISSSLVPIPELIKLDTQGSEIRVLLGAEKTLKMVRYVICAVSLKEFYESQPLFHDLNEYLHARGFELVGLNPWQMLPLPPQFDGLWKNTSLE